MKLHRVPVSIDLEFLADAIADDLTGDEVIEFILNVNARKADASFTYKLINDLHDSLEWEK